MKEKIGRLLSDFVDCFSSFERCAKINTCSANDHKTTESEMTLFWNTFKFSMNWSGFFLLQHKWQLHFTFNGDLTEYLRSYLCIEQNLFLQNCKVSCYLNAIHIWFAYGKITIETCSIERKKSIRHKNGKLHWSKEFESILNRSKKFLCIFFLVLLRPNLNLIATELIVAHMNRWVFFFLSIIH